MGFAMLNTTSSAYKVSCQLAFENGRYKTRTADCGLRTGLGIKWGVFLKIAVLSHKSQKNATFSVFSSAFELGVFYLQYFVQ